MTSRLGRLVAGVTLAVSLGASGGVPAQAAPPQPTGVQVYPAPSCPWACIRHEWNPIEGATYRSELRSEGGTPIASKVTSKLSVTWKALSPGTHYQIKTYVRVGIEESTTNAYHYIKTQSAPTDRPSNLSSTAPDGRSIDLSWRKNVNVPTFQVKCWRTDSPTVDCRERLADKPKIYFSNTSAFPLRITGLRSNTNYSYQVRGVNGSTLTPWSEVYTRSSDITGPAAPTGVQVTGGDGSVKVAWNASSSSDVAMYEVELADEIFGGHGGTGYRSSTVVPATSTRAAKLTDLYNDWFKWARVIAIDRAGNRSAVSTLTRGLPQPRTSGAVVPGTFLAVYLYANDQTPVDASLYVPWIRDQVNGAITWFGSNTDGGAVPRFQKDGSAIKVVATELGVSTSQWNAMGTTAAANAIRDVVPGLLPEFESDVKAVVYTDLRTPPDCTAAGVTAGRDVVIMGNCSNPHETAFGPAKPAKIYLTTHEMTHAFGAVSACAPHEAAGGHVDDHASDVLTSLEKVGPYVLDYNHDDYYAVASKKCPDIKPSRWWAHPS